jgi:hypothetical protein
MINKTTATLECAAQVNPAASRMSIRGSVVIAPSSHREEVLKRDQHQTKADSHPAEVARSGNPAAPEHEDADQNEQE